MNHRDQIAIQKIINEINVGFEILGDTSLEDFLKSNVLTRAIAMVEINIGELVKTITDSMRISHPEVKWKAIAGMRDIAAHKYQAINFEDVYNCLQEDFLELKAQLEEILNENNQTKNLCVSNESTCEKINTSKRLGIGKEKLSDINIDVLLSDE